MERPSRGVGNCGMGGFLNRPKHKSGPKPLYTRREKRIFGGLILGSPGGEGGKGWGPGGKNYCGPGELRLGGKCEFAKVFRK